MTDEVQLNVAVDEVLFVRFKTRVVKQRMTVKQVLTQLLQMYCDGAVPVFSDLERPKRRKRTPTGPRRT